MCGYKDQDNKSMKFEVPHLEKRKWPLQLATADWLQQEEYGDYIEVAKHVPHVGGIGDYFQIYHRAEDNIYYKDFTRFGPPMEFYPGKPAPYFNAKIETLQGYFEKKEQGKWMGNAQKTALHAFLNTPCVVFVRRFWEREKMGAKRYFKIERKDGDLIPLAGFVIGTAEINQANGHTLVTREPYPSIEAIGHHRSPVILRDDLVEEWFDFGISFQERLDIINAMDDQTHYTFEEVPTKSVTKRTLEAREPSEEGERVEATLMG